MSEPLQPVTRRDIATPWGGVSVRECGAGGAAIVFLHGIGGNADGWARQYAAFGGDLRVAGWDAPGYGDSFDFPVESPALEDYAAVFASVLDGLGVEGATVVGHSLGGLIAACAAARHPARIGRLVLAACSSGHATYDEARRQAVLRTRLDAFATGDALAYARARVKNVLSPSPTAQVFEEAVAVMSRIKQPGFPQATRMVSASDIFPYLAQIKVPTRVIYGTADQVTPPELNLRIAAAVAGAGAVAIEGAGHWLFLEFPDEFNAAVRSFLK